MRRDSLFGEQVIWSGRPSEVRAPTILRAAAVLCCAMALVSLLFGIAQMLTLAAPATRMLLFALWCLGLAAALESLPKWWLRRVRFVVTERHVIWQRGPFRRSIERSSISFARIFWSACGSDSGDLEIVRAVPTGALRRRLSMHLRGLTAPDRVWAIIRGTEAIAPAGRGRLPVAQRLDAGERVLWTARPARPWQAYLPQGQREWLLLALAAFLFTVVVRMVSRGLPVLRKLTAAGLAPDSFAFWALAMGMSLTTAILLAAAGFIVHDTLVRRGKLLGHTVYLITNRRVLIQRGNEELHVDRSSIVDVIDAPVGQNRYNVFLVLDGPRARALAASGAFGEIQRSPHLRPVFERVADAEGAHRILTMPHDPLLPRAA